MDININVKVKGGPRTPASVNAYCTAVNKKVIRFANGKQVSGVQIAAWIQEQLIIALKKLESEVTT